MRRALFWSPTESSCARCELCPHRCNISVGASGVCGTRENRGGELVAAGYGRLSSAALDPIEKKPLRLFHPGSRIFSIGGFGCNLRCPFCQNHEISAATAASGSAPASGRERRFAPEDVLDLALQTVPEGNIGVAYTYNEPLINYEFLLDCAKLVRGAGLRNVVVTNGFINAGPLEELLPFVDAMNIDLKGFTERFYENVGGSLGAVMDTISAACGRCHTEVTTLVIPGENDGDVAELSKWLASIDPDIPLHLSRFFPRHTYSGREPTPKEDIFRLRDVARERLRYVFAGNV